MGDSNLGTLVTSEQPQHGQLRPYQIEGARFLETSDSALLADEMGLGKTVQTAAALTLNKEQLRRILLITPASLCLNWQRELQRWAPEIVVRRVIGDAEDRAATFRLPIRVLIVSYEQIRSEVHRFDAGLLFNLAILDEAQRIKNPSSDISLACRLIPRERAWALSGTPLENKPADIISIFRFLKPGLLRSGMSRSEIHQRIANHFLRRTKQAVLPDLPPIIVQEIPLELSEGQRQAYNGVWASRFAKMRGKDLDTFSANMLAILTRLKQICNFDPETGESIKLDTLHDLLYAIGKENGKVLIFSQYVKTLQWISQRIDFPHDIFHGSLTQDQRDNAITEFRRRSGPRALLVSLKAGGVGLNLQEAGTVILFDRWWNPATEDQAVHRAHRFGRKQPLQVVRLLIVDTIEERVDKILREKKLLFDEYVENAKGFTPDDPSEDDLRRILQM